MENKKQENRNLLLRVSDLKQYFPVKKTKLFQKEQLYVKANDGISLDIYEGETIGLVGESGCGKSTFGRVLLQLYHQTAGQTLYYGRTIKDIAPEYLKVIYKNLPSEKKKLEERLQADPNMEQEETKQLYQKLTQAVGGFLCSDQLEEVSSLLVKWIESCEKIRDLQIEYQPVLTSLEALKESEEKNSGKLEKLNAKYGEYEKKRKELNLATFELEEKLKMLKKACEKAPNYAEYEAFAEQGIDLARLTYKEMRILRKDLQLIFQDPYSSLNPRMTVGQIIGEGLNAHDMYNASGDEMQDYVMKVMQDCGLSPYMIHRYPHQFSGGQRQRIGIARSLALKPKFVVCDEAVSALDVSIQSQIINLLLDLKEKENLTYLFISHDLSVIKYISDRIGVMYLGNMVELATTEDLFARPLHPYTEALLSAIPTTDLDHKKEAIILEGDIPSPIHPPKGCKFNTRCHYCTDICREKAPEWEEVTPGHFVACHHKRNVN